MVAVLQSRAAHAREELRWFFDLEESLTRSPPVLARQLESLGEVPDAEGWAPSEPDLLKAQRVRRRLESLAAPVREVLRWGIGEPLSPGLWGWGDLGGLVARSPHAQRVHAQLAPAVPLEAWLAALPERARHDDGAQLLVGTLAAEAEFLLGWALGAYRETQRLVSLPR
jgi:hypothetical protein